MQDDECISDFFLWYMHSFWYPMNTRENYFVRMDQNLTDLLHSVLCLNYFLIPIDIWIWSIFLVWLSHNLIWRNNIMNLSNDRWSHLLQNFQQAWLWSKTIFCIKIHERGVSLTNCWSFGNRMVSANCRAGRNQHVLYNWIKKVHRIKFRSVTATTILTANLFRPVKRRRHDSAMLGRSQLLH